MTSKTEVIVIGSGIGGLCAAAMLSKYGYSVAVFESHDVPVVGGHAQERRKEGAKHIKT